MTVSLTKAYVPRFDGVWDAETSTRCRFCLDLDGWATPVVTREVARNYSSTLSTTGRSARSPTTGTGRSSAPAAAWTSTSSTTQPASAVNTPSSVASSRPKPSARPAVITECATWAESDEPAPTLAHSSA
jgi:hypothetical protein